LTDDKRGFAEACNGSVLIPEQDHPRGAALAADEEYILRRSVETAELRGQIA
jgi:hypothetical protein